ncbi:MAG: thiol reductant ABC exporter subunit CydD, partial [Acidimicrobiales bacterium]
MSAPTTASTLGRLVRVSPPPWRRLSGALALGIAASGATVGLLAGSGALVDRAAGRPGIGVIAGLLAVVEVIAFARAPLRYGERLVAHDAGFRALARWRVWLFDRLEPLSPAGLAGWRSGDLARRAVADVDSLQDLYLRGLAPLLVAIVVGAAAVCVEGVLVPEAAAILGGALLVAMLGAPAIAWAGRPTDADRAEAGALAA